jgi:hypothetical protein
MKPGSFDSSAGQMFKSLPEDVDVALAADVIFSGYPRTNDDSVWDIAIFCQHLPASVIRRVLFKIARERPSLEVSLFLTAVVSPELTDQELKLAWSRGLLALRDVQGSYGWSHKQRSTKLLAISKSPLLLRGTQTAVVGTRYPSRDMLAVLAIDGSEESVDALIPHFDAAQKEKSNGLDVLVGLEKFFTRPAVKAMMSLAKKMLKDRNDNSGALGFSRELGLTGNPFEASISLDSIQSRRDFPKFQGTVKISSKTANWFSVEVWGAWGECKDQDTSFDFKNVERDELKLGRCEPHDLPGWLLNAQNKLEIQWNIDSLPRGTLRGKMRTQFTAWLFARCRK